MADLQKTVEDRKMVLLKEVQDEQKTGKGIAAQIGQLQNQLNVSNGRLVSKLGAYNELNALVGTPKVATAKAG